MRIKRVRRHHHHVWSARTQGADFLPTGLAGQVAVAQADHHEMLALDLRLHAGHEEQTARPRVGESLFVGANAAVPRHRNRIQPRLPGRVDVLENRVPQRINRIALAMVVEIDAVTRHKRTVCAGCAATQAGGQKARRAATFPQYIGYIDVILRPFSAPRLLPILVLALVSTIRTAPAQEALSAQIAATFADAHQSAATNVTLEAWKTAQPPFYFIYGGKASPQFIASWQKTEEPVTESPGGETHHYVYTDPATQLKITADVRTFRDFDAIDWVLHITNGGTADTPILEDIEPLHWSMASKSYNVFEHWAKGSVASLEDFQPFENEAGPTNVFTIHSDRGRSSNGTMPFFNLEDEGHGIIGAIGWTGGWQATFNHEKNIKFFDIGAGMPKTHLLLHPGETIRTPRIVFLNWQRGTWEDAQNAWRRFMIADYSPREPDGQVVRPPICDGTWGTELISAKLDRIRKDSAAKIPYDVYWVDAGWYGDEAPKPGTTVDPNSSWYTKRGTWTPNAISYPQGLGPLGDAARAAGFGFLLWIESETADAGSTLRVEHPDWFLTLPNNGVGLVNLGNPAALKGITELVSNIIDQAHMTWYRQDFNVDPDGYWASADTPDRIGMTEIKYITGLYDFWDALRSRHPGLQIDNCSSGGRRLDVETISRSISLWRSDLFCNPTDPIGGQMLTQGLAPWVPLNNGTFGGVAPGTPATGASLVYALRSNYSSGLNAGGDLPLSEVKAVLDEYREVQPYFAGDFYPLLSYIPTLENHALVTDAWTAWQFDRPDIHSGIILALRRQNSPILTIQPTLHDIDPAAAYDVEIRYAFGKTPPQHMTGSDLAHLKLTVTEEPGSALVIYHRLPKSRD
jgi:alpha-galactosidase